MNKEINYGAIGLLSIIVLAMGGTIMLSPEELDNAYICSVNQHVVIAERLSDTHKTAYFNDESKVCRNGEWLPLKQYAKDNNIDINVLINADVETANVQYSCNNKECVVIE
jgi:hypothetical protein